MIRLDLLPIACLALVVACSPSNQQPADETASDAAPERAGAPTSIAGPALWRVGDDDTTVYLFGTVHVLRPEHNWLEAPVAAALDAADTVFFEADIESTRAQSDLMAAVTELGFYTDGVTLRDVLEADEEAEVVETLALLDVPILGIDNFKPWFAAIQLSDIHLERQGFRRDAGVEEVLRARAERSGASFAFLETGAEQIELLASVPEAAQIQMLVDTATQIEDEPTLLDTLIEEWIDGDVGALETLIEADASLGAGDVREVMLTRRNANWARQLDDLIDTQPGTFFVAVGAAHLVGDDSVQAQLEPYGHLAERL